MDANLFAIIVELADDNFNFNAINVIMENLGNPIPGNMLEGRLRERRPRNANFVEETVHRFDDVLFKEHFRMTRQTFEELSIILGNHVEHNRDHIDFNKKLLFTIWTLAKPESFLAVGDRFGIAKSTGHGIFKEIVTAIANLMQQYVTLPNEAQCNISAMNFRQRSHGFPGVVGAIDGCHIPIKQPVGNAHDYYNRKGFHSIILQGTCDHKGKFIDCFIGLPGRMHDARVFQSSPLYEKLIDPDNPLLIDQFHLIGDSAYPLMTNLMCPYRDNHHLNRNQIRYNTKLSSIRSVIERAFGILKGKFRRLKYLDISDMQLANNIIAASCVVYNFLIDREEIRYEENVLEENEEVDNVQHGEADNAAVVKRNNIAALL